MKSFSEQLVSRCFLFYFALFLAGCGSEKYPDAGSGLPREEIRAKVMSIDLNASEITAVPFAIGNRVPESGELVVGKEFIFHVEQGDFGYLAPGKVFRARVKSAIVSESGEKLFRLSRVWPDDPSHRRRLDNVNRMLRRDTLSRGDDPSRMVGDYLPPFALLDQDGNLITSDFFDGKQTVLNFIFTRCSAPEMCPAATQRMGLLLSELKGEEFQDVRLVSVTMDPEFDTPGVMKAYARSHELDDPRFRFLTGPLQAVQDLKKQLGILSKPDQALVLKHTMRTILIGPDLKIAYHVPGSMWGVEDFLEKIHDLSQNKSS